MSTCVDMCQHPNKYSCIFYTNNLPNENKYQHVFTHVDIVLAYAAAAVVVDYVTAAAVVG